MNGKQRWSQMSQGKRRLVMVVGIVEGLLKLAALVDLKRRPASQVRGKKWLWATAITVISSAGVVPISYFVFGRRRSVAQEEIVRSSD